MSRPEYCTTRVAGLRRNSRQTFETERGKPEVTDLECDVEAFVVVSRGPILITLASFEIAKGIERLARVPSISNFPESLQALSEQRLRSLAIALA